MKKCTQSTALAPGPTTENASPLCLGGSDRGGWRPPSPSPGLCAPCGHPASARGITVELRAHFPLTLCPEGVLALVQGGSHSVSERHSRWSPGPLSLPVEYPGPPALLGRLHSKPPSQGPQVPPQLGASTHRQQVGRPTAHTASDLGLEVEIKGKMSE